MLEASVSAIVGLLVAFLLGVCFKRIRRLSEQTAKDNDAIKATSEWFLDKNWPPGTEPEVTVFWHAERAFINYFVARPFNWCKAFLNLKTRLAHRFRSDQQGFFQRLVGRYSEEIKTVQTDAEQVNIRLWPLAELFEEITNLFKITNRGHSPLTEIAELFMKVPEHHGVWAMSRAMQEVHERGNRRFKDIDQIVRSQINENSDSAVYGYCLCAGKFEEHVDFAGFMDNYDNLPEHLFRDQEVLRAMFGQGHQLVSRVSEESNRNPEVVEDFKTFSTTLINECRDISSQWTTVSFFRIALQRIHGHGLDEVLDDVSCHLLRQIPNSHWPVFPMTEIFEPVFCDLISRVGFSGSNQRKLRQNSSVETLRSLIKQGLEGDQRCAQLAYGTATCAAERVEGGEMDGEEAYKLLEEITNEANLANNEARELLLRWFKCRALIYPRYVRRQFSATPKYSRLARIRRQRREGRGTIKECVNK